MGRHNSKSDSFVRLLVTFLALSSLFTNYGIYCSWLEQEDWYNFKELFQKVYSSQAEERRRFEVFLQNKQYVDSHNLKAAHSSFTQSLNSLSDLTQDEINSSRNGFRFSWLPRTELEESNTTEIEQVLQLASPKHVDARRYVPPTNLDWRLEGRIGPVKNQGSCGSCWAFAATGAIEAMLRAENKSTTLVSEQHLVDCSNKYGNHGCNGGLPSHALRYVRDYGIEPAKAYPYSGLQGECRYNKNQVVFKCRSPLLLPRNDEAFLQRAVALFGPIPVAIDASSRSFHFYKSGIYDDYESCSDTINHALLLVGYGRQGNLDYWILKNSWGKQWGDDGYIKIGRNKHSCGIASYAVLPVPIIEQHQQQLATQS